MDSSISPPFFAPPLVGRRSPRGLHRSAMVRSTDTMAGKTICWRYPHRGGACYALQSVHSNPRLSRRTLFLAFSSLALSVPDQVTIMHFQYIMVPLLTLIHGRQVQAAVQNPRCYTVSALLTLLLAEHILPPALHLRTWFLATNMLPMASSIFRRD